MKFGKLCVVVCLFAVVISRAYAGVYVTAPVAASVSNPASGSASSPVHFASVFEGSRCNRNLHRSVQAGLQHSGREAGYQSRIGRRDI